MSMKVSDILAAKLEKTNKTIEKKEKVDFRFTLNKLDDEGLTERLTSLIDNITASGKRLSEHMDLSDMRKYRSLVSDFINEVVTHSHQFSRDNYLDRRGRHRVYGIVKLVNKDLDDLAQELLKEEKNPLTILEKTDEIRGLLLDIII